MKLLIVESPGKIEKLQSILGGSWTVMASYGHVRDLPHDKIGVNAPDFKPEYVPTSRGKDVLKKIKEAADKASEIYLATDPDREGEAIAWHLEDALGLQNTKRVTYTSITEKEVLDSISKARKTDMDLVYAQETRRVLDRLVGYLVTNPLNNVCGESFSAGRVQSPAVRIVAEREKAIRNFVSTTHYGVDMLIDSIDNQHKKPIKFKWNTKNFLSDDEVYNLDNKLAEKIAQIRDLVVSDYKEEETKLSPPAPFTTSSLQQSASNKLKFSPKKTMELAQKLYEQGLITYMRTDSPNLSDEATNEIRAYADSQGFELVQQPRIWKSKDGSQEAHEAIRPTHIEQVEAGSSDDEKNLYKLIWQAALGCQLIDATYSKRSAKLEARLEEYPDKLIEFEATGSVPINLGWKEIFEDFSEIEDEEKDTEPTSILPKFTVGSTICSIDGKVTTNKTKAPGRYTLAGLVKELEKKGIGRPATYASILDNIMDKGYIAEDKRKLVCTPHGEKLISAMEGFFSFLEYDYTRDMEKYLDDIAEGKNTYIAVVSDNYNIIQNEIQNLKKSKAIPCPKCQGLNLVHLKKPAKGNDKGYDYFKCNDCNENFNNQNGRPVERKTYEVTDFECLKCGSKLKHMVGESIKGKFDFFSCTSKECNTSYDNKDGQPVEQEKKSQGKLTEYSCTKCKKQLYEKTNKDGSIWFACSGYPKCKSTYRASAENKPEFTK